MLTDTKGDAHAEAQAAEPRPVQAAVPEDGWLQQEEQSIQPADARRHPSLMPCYRPLEGYRAKEPGPNGKRGITFRRSEGYSDLPTKVPCGQCIGCKLERSRQWALRCKYEAQLHDDNCFITLTFDDDHLPSDYSVNVRDFQLFMKRLRKKFSGQTIRFFHCGEYGDDNLRPHYHAILFGFDFPDKSLFRVNNGNRLYRSEILENLWPYGFCTIGAVTFESAAYVARYCLKKVTGEQADEQYLRVHPISGKQVKVLPEYATMSRRPGIGTEWLKKYGSDVYPHDYVVHDGQRMRPPKFFDNVLESSDPRQHRLVKAKRKLGAKAHAADNTSGRLRVREKVKTAQIDDKLERKL